MTDPINSMLRLGLLLCLVWPGFASAGGEALTERGVIECRPRIEDYVFQREPFALANPFLPDQALDRQQVGIQSGHYGFALDVANVGEALFGRLSSGTSYAQAARENADALLSLREGRLGLEITAGGQRYTCGGGGLEAFERKPENVPNYPLRIIDSGPFVQRYDLLGLEFRNGKGETLDRTGRLEVTGWPDRLSLTLDFADHSRKVPQGASKVEKVAVSLEGAGFSFSGQAESISTTDTLSFTLPVDLGDMDAQIDADEIKVTVTAHDTGEARPCYHDKKLGQHRIELLANEGMPTENQGELERYRVEISNPTDHEQPVRLMFDKDMVRHWKVVGMTPMIRDLRGNPTGIPVQISKNWHEREDVYPLYMGRWFHGYTMLRVPARSKTAFEFDITYGFWGGVPAASHAQLCLIGWGWNIIWQQVAIGDWCESICYQPVNPSCMIQDVRPLMTWGLDGRRDKWVWTTNVGGGDFLYYLDDGGNRRSDFMNPRVVYDEYGPNLTDVTYHYMVGDGNIAVAARVQTPRGDDLARHIHSLRYDVLKPTPFDELCLYQLGSDRYSVCLDNGSIAYGNAGGLAGEVKLADGVTTAPQSFALDGPLAWVSLADPLAMSDPNGEAFPYAPPRGLIIRKWKARLGGKDVPEPRGAVERIRREKNLDLLVRLTAPEGCHELLPGDFVEVEIELIVPPKEAGDYYGPNENLRMALERDGNTWRIVHREAIGNDLDIRVTAGRLTRNYPLEIALDDAQSAEFTVSGGLGYVPMVFSGLEDYRGFELVMVEGDKPRRIDQLVHGNDFWQTKYDAATSRWRQTYNVNLDTPGDERIERRFIFRRTE